MRLGRIVFGRQQSAEELQADSLRRLAKATEHIGKYVERTPEKRGWYKDRKGSEKVPCPECGYALSRVYDSEGVERYRECANDACGARYVTKEVFDRRIA